MKISPRRYKSSERRGRTYHRWTEKSIYALLEWLKIPQNNHTFKKHFLADAESERSKQMYQAIRASSKCLRSPSNNDLKLQLFALYQTYADFKNKKLRIQEVSIKASALVHAFSNDCPDNLLQAETECIVISDSDQVESDADTLKETDLLDSTFVGPDERSWTVSDFPNCSPLYADQPGSLICSPDCQALVNVLQALVDSQKDIASIEKKKLAVELRAVELEEQREAIRQARRCAKLMTKAARGKP